MQRPDYCKLISHDSLNETIDAKLGVSASFVAVYGQGFGESLFSDVLLAFCLGCQFVSADKLWQHHQSFILTRSHPWVPELTSQA